MSAKPSQLPRFAGTAVGSPSVEVVEPTSGQKDSGWDEGQDPPAGYFNWLHFRTFEWCQYVNDGDLRGKHTIRAVDETTYAPLLAGLDPSTGAIVSTIDHNGYRLGQITEWDEHWRTTGTTEPPAWTWTPTGGATRAYNDPTAQMPYRHVAIGTGAAETNGLLTSEYLGYLDDDKVVVFEQDIRTGGAIDSGVSMILNWRIAINGVINSVGIQGKPDDHANWRTLGETAQDLGVAIATTTTYRFRIEIAGANRHDSTDYRVRWFINGALRRSTTIAFTGDKFKASLYLENPLAGPGGGYSMTAGPLRVRFNHRASPDNL
jgi:hypothetical protein